jgi:hypothetical protein
MRGTLCANGAMVQLYCSTCSTTYKLDFVVVGVRLVILSSLTNLNESTIVRITGHDEAKFLVLVRLVIVVS